jgi:sugar lactone lactonase YvrE
MRSLLLVSDAFFSRSMRCTITALCLVQALLVCGGGNAVAQTAQFDGTQRPVALGFYEPEGVAVDQYGNLFVADADTYLISEIRAVNGVIPPNPTIRSLYRDSSNPAKITVDMHGNVFFSDANQTIKEILAVGGSIPASPTVVQLGSGLSFPQGLAVDVNGNLYAANGTSVIEMLAINGSLPPSPTILNLGSGFSGARGVAVDPLGNVYVADSGNHAVKEIVAVNGSIPTSPTILTLASNYCSPDGVSLDRQGNLYFSDYCNAAIYEILAVSGTIPALPFIATISSGAGLGGVSDVAVDSNENIYAGGVFSGTQIPQVYPSDFGSVRVGTTAGVTPLMFTLMGPDTIGSVSVTTQGAGSMDFADAGTGTCVAGGYYNSPSFYSLCTVNVTFTPKTAGTRSGAVVLKDTSGNILADGYVHGIAVAPLVNFAPPMQNTAISNVSSANGVAVDASGNLYIASTGQNQVLKETQFGGSYIQSVIPTSTLNAPHGVALDSAGNIYIADTGNNRVLKETPSPSGFKETIVDSFQAPVGVAVDQDGHFDIVYEGYGVFTGYRLDGYLGTGLSSASGIAVDINDNLYIVSNSTPDSILKESLSGGNYVSSTIPLPGTGAPTGITVDGFGSLYVSYTDSNGLGQVVKLTRSSSGYIQYTIPTKGLSQPAGITVDSTGNLFIADAGNGRIVKVDSSDPPSLSFASTPVGSTSVDSPQTVTIENVGTGGLIFPIPQSGNNPAITTNFTIDDNVPSACPVVSSGSPFAGVIQASSSCILPVSFAPTKAGSLSGSLILTDDNLYAPAPAYAVQTISLSGTATPGMPTISWPAPAATSYGTGLSSVQLNATANVPGTFSYSPAAGTVLGAGTQTLKAVFTPTDTTDYTTASATVQLTVNKATPGITWPTPAAITYGTALSSVQLDATASVPGTFAYTPAAGTILPAGTNILSAVFTPNDAVDYTTTNGSVTLVVNPAPSFTLAASPSSLSIKEGNKASSTISVNATNGFTGSVSLSVSGLPKGVTATFSPNPATKTSTITVTVSKSAGLGNSLLTITGKSGSLVQTTTITVAVVHK